MENRNQLPSPRLSQNQMQIKRNENQILPFYVSTTITNPMGLFLQRGGAIQKILNRNAQDL